MFTIQKFQLRNFFCISQIDISLDRQGLVCLVGENRDSHTADSNGSGKSAIIEGLYWTLFGETLRDIRVGDIVRRGSTKGSRGHVILSDFSGNTVEIERARKDIELGDALLFNINGKDCRGQDKKETQKVIQQTLGMTSELFRQVVLFGQGGMPRFSELGDAKQKALLEEIFQLSVYEAAAKKVRYRIKSLEDVRLIESELRMLDTQYLACLDNIQKLETSSQGWEGKKLVSIQQRQNQLQEVHVGLSANEDKLNSYCEQGYGEFSQEKVLTLQEKIQNLIWTSKDTQRSNGREQILQREFDSLLQEKAEKVAKKNNLQLQMAQMQELQEAGVCPKCRQPVGAETVHIHTSGIQNQIDQIKTQLERIEDRTREAQRQILLCREGIQAERSTRENERSKLQQELAEYLQVMRDVDTLKITVNSQKKESERLWQEIKHLEQEANGYSVLLEEERKKLTDLDGQKASRVAKKDELVKKTDQYKALLTIFGAGGIRSFLFETFVPILNQLLSKYANLASDGQLCPTISVQSETAAGEKREKIQIQVQTVEGVVPYESCSSGERRRLDLPMAMALQDLAAMRGLGLGISLLDEVFEHLDDSGISGMMKLLRESSRRAFTGTVLVITHNQEISSRFPKVWKVVRQHQVSRLEI